MSYKLYIPIASNNLSHYFVGGIIIPVKYIENRNPDIQDYKKDSILLSRYKYTANSNCAIEVIINDNEELLEKISDNYFLLNTPLPISRIKSIFFQKNEQKVQTLFNIQSGIAFLPSNLVHLSDESEMPYSEIEGYKSKINTVEFDPQIKLFDKLMGGLSVMRIARESFQNYPTHFIATLGNINAYFNSLLLDQGISISNQFEFVFNNGGKFRDLYEAIFSETSLETVQTFGKKEGIKIETKNGVIQLDKIPEGKQTYYVAILENFGAGKRKQLDSFISEFISGNLDEKRKEGIALIFGLNKGYKAFRNKYKTTNFEVDVKFHLDNQLDYYVIESIFQYVFNKKTNLSSYSYIDNWCIKASQAKLNLSQYKTYKILDTTIIYKKKLDFFEDYYQSFSQASNKVYFEITEKIKRILPDFISLESDKAISYFELHLNKPLKDLVSQIIASLQETIDSKEGWITKLESSVEQKNTEIQALKNEISNLKQNNSALADQLSSYEKSISSFKSSLHDSNLDSINIIEEPKNNYVQNSNKYNSEKVIHEKPAEKLVSNDNSEQSIHTNLNETKIETSINNYEQTINEETINIKPSNGFEFNGSLFNDEKDVDYQKNIRFKELDKLTVPQLKTIANEKKIKNISRFKKKEELVFEIIKIEFK